MKLETKHVLPYVLYGVKILTEKNLLDKKDIICTLQPSNFPNNWNTDFNSKIILRRCEDLLLDKWKFLDELSSTETQTELYNIANTSDREWVLSYTSFGFVQFLLKNHFDIFDLIPKGLAIDINTLK